MTRFDDLFDIKYVIFDAGEAQSLIGKDVFISSSLILLRDAVNNMDVDNPYYYDKLHYAKDCTTYAAFKINSDDRTFKYVYYDPYYKLKCAFKRGETIEHNRGSCWEAIDSPVFNDKPEYYRIKPNKPALKWQDLKIGDILHGPLDSNDDCDHVNDFYGMVTMIDMDTHSEVDKHICIGNIWIDDEDIGKFRRVNADGEDIE